MSAAGFRCRLVHVPGVPVVQQMSLLLEGFVLTVLVLTDSV
jgi:hypothetical protein